MTSRTTQVDSSVKAEKKRFKVALDNAVVLGNWPTTGLGLGMQVFDAIGQVADEYPNTNPESITKAQKAFADHLSHIASIR